MGRKEEEDCGSVEKVALILNGGPKCLQCCLASDLIISCGSVLVLWWSIQRVVAGRMLG